MLSPANDRLLKIAKRCNPRLLKISGEDEDFPGQTSCRSAFTPAMSGKAQDEILRTVQSRLGVLLLH